MSSRWSLEGEGGEVVEPASLWDSFSWGTKYKRDWEWSKVKRRKRFNFLARATVVFDWVLCLQLADQQLSRRLNYLCKKKTSQLSSQFCKLVPLHLCIAMTQWRFAEVVFFYWPFYCVFVSSSYFSGCCWVDAELAATFPLAQVRVYQLPVKLPVKYLFVWLLGLALSNLGLQELNKQLR